MGLVLDGRDEGERSPVHVDGDLPALAVHDGAGAVMVVLHHAVQRHIRQPGARQRRFGRTDLPPAAVHQQQVRLLAEVVVARLPVLGQQRIFFVLCRPPGDRLRQRGVVIGARHGLHFELPVACLVGLSVPEGDHAADAGAIAPVGDIVALDGAGRLWQTQHLCHLIQQLFLAGIAAALPRQTLHGVGVGHLDQVRLVAPLGDIQLHLAPPLFVQGLLQRIAVRRQLVHRDDLGDLLIVQIIAGQELLPHRRDVGGIVEEKLPLVRQPPLAEAQDRRADAAGSPGQRHHVHLHIRVHDHLLARRHLGDGVDLIPQQSRRLKFQPVRRFLHPLVQRFQDVFFAVADEMHRALDGLIVVFAADPAAAHRHALADVGVQAGAPFAAVLREALIAPGQQKGIHRRFCHLPGRKAGGVRAEILCAVVLLLQRERQARPRLFRHFDIAVALVVLQQDVIFWGVGLDLAGFQHQRLELALADDDVERIGVGDHLADFVVVGDPLPEILAHPDAQPLGLADIDDGVGLIPDDIHTGQQRQHTGFLVEFCFRHSSSSCSWFCFSSRMRLAFRML